MITKTRRIDSGHKQDQQLIGPSTTPTMADTAAQRQYAGETKPVTMKQTSQE